MADQVTNYQCPACTGPLHFDGKIGKLKCDYCGSTFTVEEVEKLFREKNEAAAKNQQKADEKAEKEAAEAAAFEKEAQAAQSAPAAADASNATGPAQTASGSGGWGNDAAKMRAYNCTSCGAELICDETTAATQCPSCGNNTIIPGQFAGTLRPDWVIPFKSEKKDAVNALKSYYQGKFLLPGSFSNNNHLEEVKGVYVPFWLYSGHVDATGQYEAKQNEVFRQGEYEITRSKHFEVDRAGTISFSRIPVDASTKMPDDLMDSIEPFDYRTITEFSLSYMPGFLANKYDISKDQCMKRADERARNTAEAELRATVTGYSTVATRAHDEQIHNEKTEYAVLPVWLLSTNWEGKNFLFAMNGQTGKMIGNLPISKMKQTITLALVFILSFLIFGSFLLGGEETSTVSYLITAAFALVLTAIVNTVLVSQMKPVAHKARAAAYVSHGGMKLSRRDDRYIKTTESRVRLQNRQAPGGGKGPGGPPPHGGPGGH